jgi:plastocyanin
MSPRTRTLIAFALCALAAPACGGDAPATRERSRSFTIRLDDYLIRPQRLSAPGGRELSLTVANRGRLGHTLRIRTPRTGKNVLSFTTIEPGESKSRRFRLARGTYRTYCVLANHEELGMYGTLVVR